MRLYGTLVNTTTPNLRQLLLCCSHGPGRYNSFEQLNLAAFAMVKHREVNVRVIGFGSNGVREGLSRRGSSRLEAVEYRIFL